jgi:hypothetical protein
MGNMLFLAKFGAFLHFEGDEGPLGTPDQYHSVCFYIVLVVIYLFQAIRGLNHLDSSGYIKI